MNWIWSHPLGGRLHEQKVLGHFSTDTERRYCNDDRNRRYFIEPDNVLGFDYTIGFDDYVGMGGDPHVMSLDNILLWMRDHREVLIENEILDPSQSRLNVDFVGRRGTFKNLLEAGGNKDTDIRLVVTLYRGTYYISEFTGMWKTHRPQNRDDRMVAASSKLFLRSVTSKDGCPENTPTPVNDNASYYAMMSASCGTHRTLFSSEVQAEWIDEITPPPWKYLNIRTNAQDIIHPMKALRWWAPNILSGIPQIVCGLRDDERRIIQTFEYIDIDQLPTEYSQNKWEPEVCIKTMDSLLSQIKELVQEDDASCVYHLVLEPTEGGPELGDRLQSRTFFSKGKRSDSFALIEESLVQDIFDEN